jgi:hypothetical protein
MTTREAVLTEIYDNAELWELCWPLTDAYGEPGLVPPQGYDWSGFRDSSDEAIAAMAAVLERRRAPRCPSCGGVLQLVRDGMVGVTMARAFHTHGQQLRRAWQLRPFWACAACEFCTANLEEIRTE